MKRAEHGLRDGNVFQCGIQSRSRCECQLIRPPVPSIAMLRSLTPVLALNKPLFRSFARTNITRPASTQEARDEIKKTQNRLFEEEKLRQERLIARVEKVRITVKDVKPETEDVVLIMNKGISTPHDCGMHISDMYAQFPVAEVDGVLWDMHRPLPADSTLRFRQFVEDDPYLVNVVFWRSCSFLMGMVIDTAFKQEHQPVLHSWPKPSIRSGSFVYDAALHGLPDWTPTDSEMMALTSAFWKIKSQDLRFERLDVPTSLAKEIFASNSFKSSQLSGFTAEKVSLYRVGDHIDISIGPMIANTGIIGRVAVTAVHRVERGTDGPLYRFQGVGLPSTLMMNHFAFNVLLQRSKELNDAGLS